ncbi:MAG TPA: YciI family protein [Micromonosporaceae bacterium]
MGTDRHLLGRDYWLVLSTPVESTTALGIEAHLDAHLAWLLRLEADGTVFLSGPLTSGRDIRPGAGITVLRADSAEQAGEIAAGDPFVLAGLRTFDVFGWRVNEGAINLRMSLGTGTYSWD